VPPPPPFIPGFAPWPQGPPPRVIPVKSQPKQPPLTWAQVAKKASKAGVKAPTAPTPRGTAPRPQRYVLTAEEQLLYKRGVLPERLLSGFISRAVGAYRHLSGMTRPGPLPKATFAMIKRTACRSLQAACNSYMLSETRRLATLKAQAASRACREKRDANREEPAEVPPKVVTVVREVEKVVKERYIPDDVTAELAKLRAEVDQLKKATKPVQALAVPSFYKLNQFKGYVYGGHTVAELAKAPKDHVQRDVFPESSNYQLDVKYQPTFFDYAISCKDASSPAITFLRISRKTGKVAASAPVPAFYMPMAMRVLSRSFTMSLKQLGDLGGELMS